MPYGRPAPLSSDLKRSVPSPARVKTTSVVVLVHSPAVLGRSGSVRSRSVSSLAVPEESRAMLLQLTVTPRVETVVFIRTTSVPFFPSANTAVRVPCGCPVVFSVSGPFQVPTNAFGSAATW